MFTCPRAITVPHFSSLCLSLYLCLPVLRVQFRTGSLGSYVAKASPLKTRKSGPKKATKTKKQKTAWNAKLNTRHVFAGHEFLRVTCACGRVRLLFWDTVLAQFRQSHSLFDQSCKCDCRLCHCVIFNGARDGCIEHIELSSLPSSHSPPLPVSLPLFLYIFVNNLIAQFHVDWHFCFLFCSFSCKPNFSSYFSAFFSCLCNY